MIRRNFAFLVLAAAASLAQAQSYPTKPIRMIIPSTPGGGTDFIGRLVSTKLSALNGWTIVPDNRPGANLTLGLGEAARGNAAGYDLVIGQTDNVSLAPLLMKLSFDAVKDLAPVALIATTPIVLVVPESSPYKTLADVIRAAKAAPGTISYGSSGTGSATHITMELLQSEGGFKMQHIPYKGSTPAMADLMGGHLGLAGGSIATAASLIRSGKIRALAVSSPKRNPALPDVPAMGELGYKDLVIYYGVLAPAATPHAVIARLNSDFNKILEAADVRAALLAQGLDPSPMSVEDFGALIKADVLKAKNIFRTAGIKAE